MTSRPTRNRVAPNRGPARTLAAGAAPIPSSPPTTDVPIDPALLAADDCIVIDTHSFGAICNPEAMDLTQESQYPKLDDPDDPDDPDDFDGRVRRNLDDDSDVLISSERTSQSPRPPEHSELANEEAVYRSRPPALANHGSAQETTRKATQQATRKEQESGKSSHVKWSEDMEKTLLNELLNQVQNGKKADSGFKKEAWVAVLFAVLEITTQQVTIQQCKNKADALKAQWKDLCYLREQSGFGWDDENNMVEAPDDVWDRLLKVSYIYIYSG
jgi:Myb/SANT-like DNA-binding domain